MVQYATMHCRKVKKPTKQGEVQAMAATIDKDIATHLIGK